MPNFGAFFRRSTGYTSSKGHRVSQEGSVWTEMLSNTANSDPYGLLPVKFTQLILSTYAACSQKLNRSEILLSSCQGMIVALQFSLAIMQIIEEKNCSDSNNGTELICKINSISNQLYAGSLFLGFGLAKFGAVPDPVPQALEGESVSDDERGPIAEENNLENADPASRV